MRAVTQYFLNRIKKIASTSDQIGEVVEPELLRQKVPPISNERQMRMETELDRIDVSIETLHKIQEQRKIS